MSSDGTLISNQTATECLIRLGYSNDRPDPSQRNSAFRRNSRPMRGLHKDDARRLPDFRSFRTKEPDSLVHPTCVE